MVTTKDERLAAFLFLQPTGKNPESKFMTFNRASQVTERISI